MLYNNTHPKSSQILAPSFSPIGVSKYIYIYITCPLWLKWLEDLGSIQGWVLPKTQKMVLDTSLLNIQHYKVWIKVKYSYPGKGVAPSPTPRCSSYWKGSPWVTLDYGCELYFYLLLVCAYAFIPNFVTLNINYIACYVNQELTLQKFDGKYNLSGWWVFASLYLLTRTLKSNSNFQNFSSQDFKIPYGVLSSQLTSEVITRQSN